MKQRYLHNYDYLESGKRILEGTIESYSEKENDLPLQEYHDMSIIEPEE